MTSSAFGSQHYVVADGEMSGNACLSRQYHAITNVRTAGQTNLRAQQSVFADCA